MSTGREKRKSKRPGPEKWLMHVEKEGGSSVFRRPDRKVRKLRSRVQTVLPWYEEIE